MTWIQARAQSKTSALFNLKLLPFCLVVFWLNVTNYPKHHIKNWKQKSDVLDYTWLQIYIIQYYYLLPYLLAAYYYITRYISQKYVSNISDSKYKLLVFILLPFYFIIRAWLCRQLCEKQCFVERKIEIAKCTFDRQAFPFPAVYTTKIYWRGPS